MVDLEMAVSNNDNNLFSSIDDANNTGISTKISAKQRIFSKDGTLMLSIISISYRNFPLSRKVLILNLIETGI
jgi:hypothetical protein